MAETLLISKFLISLCILILIPWYLKGLYFGCAKILEMIKLLVKNLIKTMGEFKFKTKNQALYSDGESFIGGFAKAKDLKSRKG